MLYDPSKRPSATSYLMVIVSGPTIAVSMRPGQSSAVPNFGNWPVASFRCSLVAAALWEQNGH
jgi:hypothetical protein